jgi:hypothetical protein
MHAMASATIKRALLSAQASDHLPNHIWPVASDDGLFITKGQRESHVQVINKGCSPST